MKLRMKMDLTVTLDETSDEINVAGDVNILGGPAPIEQHAAAGGVLVAEIAHEIAKQAMLSPCVLIDQAHRHLHTRRRVEDRAD